MNIVGKNVCIFPETAAPAAPPVVEEEEEEPEQVEEEEEDDNIPDLTSFTIDDMKQ